MLTNTTNVARYLINTTPLSTYSISFPYWDKEEIKVYLTKADGTLETLVEGTNYTLTTPNGVSGTLTRVGDWTAGATNLTIMREMDLTQEVDLRNGDKIDAETLETAFDTATAQIQQLSEAQSRAVTTSVDEAGGNLAIPSKALRAGSGSGTMMGFGPDGNEVVLRDLAGFDADVASAASNASSASASAGTATTQALKSEGYAVGEQNGSPVTSGSPYYQNNSKHYAQVAKAGADVITDNITAITNLDTNMTDINAVADDISNVVAVAGDLTKVDAVADDLTNIDAVNANKTNIDTVAGIASDVTNVAGVASDIPTVAGVSTDISTVATDISDVSAVAGDLAKVKAVADDLTNIDAVNANKTNIDTVAGKASEITTVAGIASNVTTVAGIASNVTTVAGKASEVTTVAGIASDVSAVAQVASDVASVADELTDIGTVASNISDVAAVGADIAKVSAVADDLTSIDAVYADLANIDAADDHALEAEGWAAGTQNGVPVTSGSPYYENNAKYYGQEIPNLKDALSAQNKRIENLEEAHGSYHEVDVKSVYTIPSGKGSNWIVDGLRGVSRADNNLVKNSTFSDGTTNWNWNPTNIDVSTSDGILEMTMKGDEPSVGKTAWGISQAIGKVTAGHVYLICGEFNSPSSAVGYDFNNQTINGTVTANVWSTFNAVRTAIDHSTPTFYLFPAGLTNGQKMKVRNVHIKDLNVYFNTADLSFLGATDSAKLATIQTNYPWLLTPSDYGTSAVNTVYEGVRSTFKNLCNTSAFENVNIGGDGGVYAEAFTASSSDYIPVKANMEMILSAKTSVKGLRIAEYDADKNFLVRVYASDTTSCSATMLGNTRFVRWIINYNGSTTVTKAILDSIEPQLEYGSSRTTFSAYKSPVTLTFPSPISLKSAGSVAEEYYPETGRVTHPIGQVDLGTLTGYTLNSTDSVNVVISDRRNGSVNSICSQLVQVASSTSANDMPSGSFKSFVSGNSISIKLSGITPDNAQTMLSGVIFYYELATPSADTFVDPILNNLIATEAGGTLEAVKTYPIDDSFTVGYLTL